MKRVYITHCSAKKNITLKNRKIKVEPNKMYTATPIQRFMNKCKEMDVDWAIFSDNYGIWHPDEKHEWYEKNPNKVNEEEFKKLVVNFDKALGGFDEIWFYNNPGRFHRLYRKLIEASSLKDRIKCFTHIHVIEKK